MKDLSRRLFLTRAMQGAALASVSGLGASLISTPAFAAKGPAIVTTPLAPNLSLISGGGGNVVALGTKEGSLLVDGGSFEKSSDVLREASKATGASKVKVLINTHWHPDQTGSNERIGKSGATIIAHENTKLWLARPIKASWLPKPFGPLPEKARPGKTTYTHDSLSFAGQDIEYGYMLQAHTDGDLYVHFKQANVLVAGGVVSGEGWPLLDWETGGWIAGLVAGYDKLLKVADANTKIVPANGPVITKADLEAQQKMYQTIFQRMNQLLRKGMGPEEVLAANPTKEFDAQWGEPTKFVTLAFKSLWGHLAPDA